MKEEEKKTLEEIRATAEKIAGVAVDAGYKTSVISEYALIADDTTKEEARDALFHGISLMAHFASEMITDIETTALEVQRSAESMLQDPEEKGHRPTEEELRDMYRERHTNEAVENKTRIAEELASLLQGTRAGENVGKIEVSEDQTTAHIHFRFGSLKDVNIEGDSGIAMIVDICRALM